MGEIAMSASFLRMVSGLANVGAHFLPYDPYNFELKSARFNTSGAGACYLPFEPKHF